MPSFIALGCVEVGEKFMLVSGGAVISSTKITLHQPELGLSSVRLGCNNIILFCRCYLQPSTEDQEAQKACRRRQHELI